MSWGTWIAVGVVAWAGALTLFLALLRAAARGDLEAAGPSMGEALRQMEGRVRHGAEPIVRALERRRETDRRRPVASPGAMIADRRGPSPGRRRDDRPA